MANFFGTDGIRGIVNEDLNHSLITMIGNALAKSKTNAKILIGRDTRISGTYIVSTLTSGALQGGANVVDVGIIPTAGISYLTNKLGYDYGVVISASHNPPQYNGIKIFNSSGIKLNESEEETIEKLFNESLVKDSLSVGSYTYSPNLTNIYINHLVSSCTSKLNNLKIVLDCGNGASFSIAPKVFRELGAKVIPLYCKNNGKNINVQCGALNTQILKNKVLSCKANLGFAFDGDSDRVIAIDEKGNELNGDEIVYILANHFKKKNKLNKNTVVGTSLTNSGIISSLKEKGISFVKTDVGDKYVIEAMEKHNLNLGGEQSGHIIIKDIVTTGDGILSALFLTQCVLEENKPLSSLCDFQNYFQVYENIVVDDKLKIINNISLKKEIIRISDTIGEKGRVLVRASGTEPKIRIMIEHQEKEIATKHLDTLVKIIKNI